MPKTKLVNKRLAYFGTKFEMNICNISACHLQASVMQCMQAIVCWSCRSLPIQSKPISYYMYGFLELWTTYPKKPVKYLKNWNMIGFVMLTYHIFSSNSFWANLVLILRFSLIFHCLKAGFVPCPGDKLMFPNLTTRDCEYYSWFLYSCYPVNLTHMWYTECWDVCY